MCSSRYLLPTNRKKDFFLHVKRAWGQVQEWEASPRLSRAPPTSRSLPPLPGTDYGFCPPACVTTATGPCTAHASFTTVSIPSSRSRRRAARGLLAASSVLVVVIFFPLISFLYLDLISLTNLSWFLCRFRFSCFLNPRKFFLLLLLLLLVSFVVQVLCSSVSNCKLQLVWDLGFFFLCLLQIKHHHVVGRGSAEERSVDRSCARALLQGAAECAHLASDFGTCDPAGCWGSSVSVGRARPHRNYHHGALGYSCAHPLQSRFDSVGGSGFLHHRGPTGSWHLRRGGAVRHLVGIQLLQGSPSPWCRSGTEYDDMRALPALNVILRDLQFVMISQSKFAELACVLLQTTVGAVCQGLEPDL